MLSFFVFLFLNKEENEQLFILSTDRLWGLSLVCVTQHKLVLPSTSWLALLFLQVADQQYTLWEAQHISNVYGLEGGYFYSISSNTCFGSVWETMRWSLIIAQQTALATTPFKQPQPYGSNQQVGRQSHISKHTSIQLEKWNREEENPHCTVKHEE